MRIRAVALPGSVATALDENADLIRMTLAASQSSPSDNPQTEDTATSSADVVSIDAQTDTATASSEGISTDAQTDVADTPAASIDAQTDNADTSAASTDAQTDNADTSGGHEAGVFTNGNASSHELRSSELQADASNASPRAKTDARSPDAGEAAVDNGNKNDSQLSAVSASGALSDASVVSRSLQKQAAKAHKAQAGALDGIDGLKGRAMDGSVDHNTTDNLQHQDQNGNSSVASGKVGILKQRLLAAAKDTKAGPPGLLQVSHVEKGLIQSKHTFSHVKPAAFSSGLYPVPVPSGSLHAAHNCLKSYVLCRVSAPNPL